MTDRLKGAWVAFDHDIREDDAKCLIDAIKMLRGVLEVKTEVSSSDDWIAESRIRHELGKKLLDIVYPKRKT